MRLLAAVALLGLAFLACTLPSADEYAGGDAGTDASAAGTDAGPKDATPDVEVSVDAGDPYGDAVRADGPAAWYRLDDPEGSVMAKDETGNHAARVEGVVRFGSPGISGTAAHFQNEGAINLGDIFDFAGLTEYSIELWLAPEPNGSDFHVVDKRGNSSGAMIGWLLYTGGGQSDVHFEFWGTPVFQKSDGALPATLTHVVVVTRIATGMELATMYIDGVAQTNVVGGAPGPDTAQPLTLGASLIGTLDEVAFYDKPLPLDRIRAHRKAISSH